MRIAALLLVIFLIGCASPKLVKHSDHDEMYSASMGKNMAFSVYTPPNWSAQENLPLMVLLHGAKDSEKSFDRFEVGKYLDQKINAGELPRVIVVNPDGGLGFWENWYDGSRLYRDWVVKDLIPLVQERYNTRKCPEACYLTGVSMGAHGVLRFAEFEHELFSSYALISGRIISPARTNEKEAFPSALVRLIIPFKKIWGERDGINSNFTNERDPYTRWLEPPLISKPLFITWGSEDHDAIIKSSQEFHRHLTEQGREHEMEVYDGQHLWVDWRYAIARSIEFHQDASQNFRLSTRN
jgi:enterochelin esterase-like enzyme